MGARIASGRQPGLDACLGRGELRRQVPGELLEQLVVQRQLGPPGAGIDAGHLVVLRRAEVQAFSVQVLVAGSFNSSSIR